jgi:hypothetical protein
LLKIFQPQFCMYFSSLPCVLFQHIFLDLITLIIFCEACYIMKFLIIQSSATSYHLGANILFSTPFSYIPNLCSSHSVKDQVSHPYKAAGKIIIFCILICKFLERRWEDNYEQNSCEHSPDIISSISSWMQFWFVTVVSKYLNTAPFSKDLLAISKLWFWSAFWCQDTGIYLVFSVLTSKPMFLLACNRAFVFLWYLCFH